MAQEKMEDIKIKDNMNQEEIKEEKTEHDEKKIELEEIKAEKIEHEKMEEKKDLEEKKSLLEVKIEQLKRIQELKELRRQGLTLHAKEVINEDIKPLVLVSDSSSLSTICDICKKQFSTRKTMVQHKRKVHTLRDRSSMSVPHSMVHSIKGDISEQNHNSKNKQVASSIQCEICRKTFTRKDTLVKHKRTLHYFGHKEDVQKVVLLRHHEVRQSQDITKEPLKEAHSLEKAFSCPKCKKGFNVKSNMINHRDKYCIDADAIEKDEFSSNEEDNDDILEVLPPQFKMTEKEEVATVPEGLEGLKYTTEEVEEQGINNVPGNTKEFKVNMLNLKNIRESIKRLKYDYFELSEEVEIIEDMNIRETPFEKNLEKNMDPEESELGNMETNEIKDDESDKENIFEGVDKVVGNNSTELTMDVNKEDSLNKEILKFPNEMEVLRGKYPVDINSEEDENPKRNDDITEEGSSCSDNEDIKDSDNEEIDEFRQAVSEEKRPGKESEEKECKNIEAEDSVDSDNEESEEDQDDVSVNYDPEENDGNIKAISDSDCSDDLEDFNASDKNICKEITKDDIPGDVIEEEKKEDIKGENIIEKLLLKNSEEKIEEREIVNVLTMNNEEKGTKDSDKVKNPKNVFQDEEILAPGKHDDIIIDNLEETKTIINEDKTMDSKCFKDKEKIAEEPTIEDLNEPEQQAKEGYEKNTVVTALEASEDMDAEINYIYHIIDDLGNENHGERISAKQSKERMEAKTVEMFKEEARTEVKYKIKNKDASEITNGVLEHSSDEKSPELNEENKTPTDNSEELSEDEDDDIEEMGDKENTMGAQKEDKETLYTREDSSKTQEPCEEEFESVSGEEVKVLEKEDIDMDEDISDDDYEFEEEGTTHKNIEVEYIGRKNIADIVRVDGDKADNDGEEEVLKEMAEEDLELEGEMKYLEESEDEEESNIEDETNTEEQCDIEQDAKINELEKEDVEQASRSDKQEGTIQEKADPKDADKTSKTYVETKQAGEEDELERKVEDEEEIDAEDERSNVEEWESENETEQECIEEVANHSKESKDNAFETIKAPGETQETKRKEDEGGDQDEKGSEFGEESGAHKDSDVEEESEVDEESELDEESEADNEGDDKNIIGGETSETMEAKRIREKLELERKKEDEEKCDGEEEVDLGKLTEMTEQENTENKEQKWEYLEPKETKTTRQMQEIHTIEESKEASKLEIENTLEEKSEDDDKSEDHEDEIIHDDYEELDYAIDDKGKHNVAVEGNETVEEMKRQIPVKASKEAEPDKRNLGMEGVEKTEEEKEDYLGIEKRLAELRKAIYAELKPPSNPSVIEHPLVFEDNSNPVHIKQEPRTDDEVVLIPELIDLDNLLNKYEHIVMPEVKSEPIFNFGLGDLELELKSEVEVSLSTAIE